MDIVEIISSLHGWFFLIITFAISSAIVIFRGKQTLINLMMGSYLGTFLYIQFPFKDFFLEAIDSNESESIALLFLFGILTFLSAWLFSRLMRREYFDDVFDSFPKKIILAITATILFTSLSLFYLPVENLIDISKPIPELLLNNDNKFYWLLVPLIILFFI